MKWRKRITRGSLLAALILGMLATAVSGCAVPTLTQSSLSVPDTLSEPALAAFTEPAPSEQSEQPSVPPEPMPLSNRVAEYHISVELDPQNKALHGTQTLIWTNPGQKPVSEMYFHLYPNAFESKKTTFMRESGGKLRNDQMKENSFGRMDITSMKLSGGQDLTARMQFTQPDDGNLNDHTLMKLKLPEAVLPGQKVTISIKFDVILPYTFARMGYADNFYMAGQWFPKIAVYEPAGVRGRTEEGWNAHQYHGNSEFYADFGIYNVKIKVPENYTVAATGFPAGKTVVEGKMKTVHFYADDVHDFAWSASPDFVYAEEPYSTDQLPGVKIKLYLDPTHKQLQNRYMLAAKKALAKFSEWYGPYPYSTLSIVVPPKGANGAGGMEYPTLVTAWGADHADSDLEIERVVVHEIAHQYFYGIIASNEFEEAWLDEGFASYAEEKIMDGEYGLLSNHPIEGSYITSPAPLKLNAWDYGGHGQYADNVYIRAKLVLTSIEQQIGTKQMNKVMRTYYERWKFRHPTTRDFQRVLEDVTRKDWSDYFKHYVYGGMMVDFSVESIKTKPIKSKDGKMYESKVTIKRNGGPFSPVPIQFRFADGTDLNKEWNGQEEQMQFKLTYKAPLQWVRIDPNYTMVLENKHINNFMRTKADQTWQVRLSLGVVKLLELALSRIAW